jgi:hypothetical protein
MMKSDKVLQHCLPGVTVHDQYHGYQSLQVESPSSLSGGGDLDFYEGIPLWLEDARTRQQRRTSLYFNASLAIMTLLILCKWHQVHYTTTVTTTSLGVTYLPRTSTGSDEEDQRKQQILHALTKLDEEMEGDIVLVSSKEKFETAARVWRQGLEPPLAVIEAKTQQDVEKALPILTGLAKDFQLDFRVRSGGHSPAGYSTVGSEGVVLSLSKLTSLTLHHSNRTETNTTTFVMEPGVRVEQFLHDVLDQGGYGGVVAEAAGVAMGGFILGGGYGFQSRMYGLGIDNVVQIRVVLTNGVVKDVEEGDDLFWALRGAGGGNLGVVTEVIYRVYPSKDMKLAATVKVPFVEVVNFLQKLGQKEPELLAGEFIAVVHGYEHCPYTNHASSPSGSETTTSTTLIRQSPSTSSSGLASRDSFVENGTATVNKLYWMGDSDLDDDDKVGMEYMKKHLMRFRSFTIKPTCRTTTFLGRQRQDKRSKLRPGTVSGQHNPGMAFCTPKTTRKPYGRTFEKTCRSCFATAPISHPRLSCGEVKSPTRQSM